MTNLGLSIAGGTISEAVKQVFGMSKPTDPKLNGIAKFAINKENSERLAGYLCKMRGAALKLGQVLTTLDDVLVPTFVKDALERARSQADIMPKDQVVKCLEKEYGKNWNKRFKEFDLMPIAAASIGQVHRAVLPGGEEVAVKLQYPGVANSITVDLNNFMLLSNAFQLFPKAVFIDSIIETIKKDFEEECDYLIEAKKQNDYKQFVSYCDDLYVPKVFMDYTTKRSLCMEFIHGVHIDEIAKDEKNIY